MNSYLRSVLVALAILPAVMPVDSQACNVPAFRYALERWPADPYQILVYCQSVPQGEAFELLRKGTAAKGGAANFSLKAVDVLRPEGKALAEQRKITAYPWVEVLYPAHSHDRAAVWSGPLTSDRVRRILNSPIRSRLAEKLLGGDVAVWVLIRSGHESKDLRALASLETHLERASATLRIPDIGTGLNGEPVEVTDFKSYPVRFSLVEIAHDNPEEALLVNALLMSESDLEDSDEPVAFPVFGRGRALYALVGNGIDEKNIRVACQSMLAWCSCEIKAQNPGTDLLIAADWSRPYGGKMVSDPELPLAGLSGFAQDTAAVQTKEKPAPKVDPMVPEAARTPAPVVCGAAASARSEAPPARPSGDSLLMRNLLIFAGAAGLALLGLSVVVAVKAKR